MITNCKNCGAPLNAQGNCDYCGTKYKRISEIDFHNVNKIKILFDEREVEFTGYISDLEISYDNAMSYRDINGILHRTKSRPIIKFNFFGEGTV